jgi:predicted tellurium resistance membrane protein TerC
MEHFFTAEGLIALLTLTLLEIVLGVDNIIFISIVTNKVPKEDQKRTRLIGLSMALIVRIILLLGITLIIKSKTPLFTVFNLGVSIRDIILLLGGLFLIGKSTSEIHHKIEGEQFLEDPSAKVKSTMMNTIIQIILLDIIFSFDSILTAVGLVTPDKVLIMITAIIISMVVMLFFAQRIAHFISHHPTIELLALSFLILIGFMLTLESVHIEVPKGYIYFAVFFSLIVELLNLRMRKKKDTHKVNEPKNGSKQIL